MLLFPYVIENGGDAGKQFKHTQQEEEVLRKEFNILFIGLTPQKKFFIIGFHKGCA